MCLVKLIFHVHDLLELWGWLEMSSNLVLYFFGQLLLDDEEKQWHMCTEQLSRKWLYEIWASLPSFSASAQPLWLICINSEQSHYLGLLLLKCLQNLREILLNSTLPIILPLYNIRKILHKLACACPVMTDSQGTDALKCAFFLLLKPKGVSRVRPTSMSQFLY